MRAGPLILLLLFSALALAQAGTSTLRTGDLARSLSAAEIANIQEVVGSKPWLIDGRHQSDSRSQTITAYFAPTTETPTFRRGGYMTFSREMNPVPGPWKGVGSARPYVQVGVPGRPLEEIRNDQDLNRPFTVTGSFEIDQLVELLAFIRSNPAVIPDQLAQNRGWTGSVGTYPITSLEFRRDGSVIAGWFFEDNYGQTAILEKRDKTWVVTSLRRFRRFV